MRREFAIMILIVVVMAFVGVVYSPAANQSNWKVRMQGTIIDVDPLANPGSSGLFFELQDNRGKCHWLWIWGEDMDKSEYSWPVRGDTGTFYTRKIDGDDKYKWVPIRESSSSKAAKKTKSTVAKKVTPAPISSSWESAKISPPPEDKTVLVRYVDGTYTTAYLDSERKWKLETDRNRVRGGYDITSKVKEWKVIPE